MAKTATFGNKVYYGWPSSDFYSARNLRLALLTLALLTLSHDVSFHVSRHSS